MKKKFLALAVVAALVSALVIPMTVYADGTSSSGTNTVSGSVVTASITVNAPANVSFGNFKAGWNVGGSAGTLGSAGSVTFAPGSDGVASWTVTAMTGASAGSGTPFMMGPGAGAGTPLTDYLLISSFGNADPSQANVGSWFIANGGSGTVGSAGLTDVTGINNGQSISGVLTYTGSASATLPFYAAQYLTSSDNTPGAYTITITFAGSCEP